MSVSWRSVALAAGLVCVLPASGCGSKPQGTIATAPLGSDEVSLSVEGMR